MHPDMKVIMEEMRQPWLDELGKDIETECSCVECLNNDSTQTCEWAFDLYNTSNGTYCLAMK